MYGRQSALCLRIGRTTARTGYGSCTPLASSASIVRRHALGSSAPLKTASTLPKTSPSWPKEEKFTIYPLPSRVTYTREIDFDDDGGIWTSNSNTPGWHIETENPQIIRLRAGGDGAKAIAAR